MDLDFSQAPVPLDRKYAGKNRRSPVFKILTITLLIIILIALFWPVNTGRPASPKTIAVSNAKQIAIGLILYASDNDDHLPQPNQWQTEVKGYIKNEDILKSTRVTTDNKPTQLAMNSAISGKALSSVRNPSTSVLVFLSALQGSNPHGGQGDIVQTKENYTIIAFADSSARAPSISQMEFSTWSQ